MRGKVRLDLQSRPQRVVLILGPWLAYALAFAPLHRVMGAGAGALAAIPVVVVAWLMGIGGALLAAVLVVLLNTVLFNLAGLHGWDAILQAGGGPGTIALVLIGLGVGRLRDLRERANIEIARRNQVEEALRTSEARLRTLVSNVPVILFAVDRSGVFTLSEGKGLEALGAQPGEVVGRAISDVYHSRPQIVEAVDRALAGEEVTSTTELAGLTFEATYTPVRGDDGAITGVIGVAIDVTERKRQQAEVEAARTYLQTLQESNPDCIVATDEKGRIVVFNPGAEELLGYAAEEVVGQPVEQLYPSREAAKAVMRAMRAANGRTRNLETLLRHQGGRDIPVLLSAAILRGVDGKEQGTVGYAKDLTERKRMEEEFRKARDKAQRYLDIAGVMLVALDEKGEITLINQKGCAILGYEERELIGTNWFDMCLPERIREEVWSVFVRLMAGDVEPVEHYENPVLTRSGEERIIAWHNTVLTDSTGNIIGALSSGEDITERKQTEAALRESEERFRSLAQTATDGIITIGADSRIRVFNKAAELIFGFSAEEAVGQHISMLIPEEYGSRHTAAIERYLNTRQPRVIGKTVELKGLRKGGEIFPIELSLSEATVGGETTFTGILRDVTERKRTENELRESRAWLQEIVRSIDDLLVVYDRDGRYVDVMTRHSGLLFMPADELIGRTVTELLPAQLADKFVLAIQAILDHGTPQEIEYSLPVEGGVHWFRARGLPLSGTQHGNEMTLWAIS
ncbi:MAG: PAS domain S-box protein, partial [Anaerolineae bacterium]